MSKKPLFQQGSSKLRPGLWAFLVKDCRAPVDDHLFDWPSCAKPVRIRPKDITAFSPEGPIALPMVSADSAPMIIQVAMTPDQVLDGAPKLFSEWPGEKRVSPRSDEAPIYAYLSFQSAGTSPAEKGMLTLLQCPSDEVPGIYVPPSKETTAADGSKTTEYDTGCEARTASAVRMIARNAIGDWPTWRAVWIADVRDIDDGVATPVKE